jgi:hypothetical protein
MDADHCSRAASRAGSLPIRFAQGPGPLRAPGKRISPQMVLVGVGPDADRQAKLLICLAVDGHCWTLIHSYWGKSGHGAEVHFGSF